MAEEILLEAPQSISELTLIPSRGGVFEVTFDGDLVYSKRKTGRHAEEGEIMGTIRPRL